MPWASFNAANKFGQSVGEPRTSSEVSKILRVKSLLLKSYRRPNLEGDLIYLLTEFGIKQISNQLFLFFFI